jgi:hypothetical protein
VSARQNFISEEAMVEVRSALSRPRHLNLRAKDPRIEKAQLTGYCAALLNDVNSDLRRN